MMPMLTAVYISVIPPPPPHPPTGDQNQSEQQYGYDLFNLRLNEPTCHILKRSV